MEEDEEKANDSSNHYGYSVRDEIIERHGSQAWI